MQITIEQRKESDARSNQCHLIDKEAHVLNRRQLLHRTAGVLSSCFCPTFAKAAWTPSELGTPPPWGAEYVRALKDSKWLTHIGIPPSRELARHGLYPFAPERIVTLRQPHLVPDHLKRQVLAVCLKRRELFWNRFPEHRDIVERTELGTSRDRGWLTLSVEKLDVLLNVVQVLSEYYACPEAFEKWATTLAEREEEHFTQRPNYDPHTEPRTEVLLGDVPVRLFHGYDRYRSDTDAITVDERVDWWAFLFPEGAEWDDWFGPVHVLVGLVATDRFREAVPGYRFNAGSLLHVLMHRVLSDPAKLSTLKPLDAAHRLNREFGMYLRQPEIDRRTSRFGLTKTRKF